MESQNRKKLALLVIGVLVIAGGIYVFLLTTASTTPNILADWKTYRNEKYEFEFRYPQAWEITDRGCSKEKCIIEITTGVLKSVTLGSITPSTIMIEVLEKSLQKNAQAEIAKIQEIIDAYDTIPPGTFGAETNYGSESNRYSVNNLKNLSGVDLYHYNFIGKYSITSRVFYFDTLSKTIRVLIDSDQECMKGCDFNEDKTFFNKFSEIKNFLWSIKLLSATADFTK